MSGRWVDEILSRLFDALISIPSKVLALVVIAAFGSSIPMLMAVAALAYIPGAFRISRSLAVNLMTLEYVQVARARGEGLFYIARVEVLPNMIHPMLADFGLRFVFIVLAAERPELPRPRRAAAERRLGFARAREHRRPCRKARPPC